MENKINEMEYIIGTLLCEKDRSNYTLVQRRREGGARWGLCPTSLI